jgi:hypothetical protein
VVAADAAAVEAGAASAAADAASSGITNWASALGPTPRWKRGLGPLNRLLPSHALPVLCSGYSAQIKPQIMLASVLGALACRSACGSGPLQNDPSDFASA